jgi:hypothetical protein
MAAISEDEPSLKEAINGHERAEWIKAIEAELTQIERLHTWDLIGTPPDTNVIPSGYVFHQKHDSNGIIKRYKACCIAKGYRQQFGVNYTDTFTPTVCPATLQILLSLAAQWNVSIHQIDVKNTYLNSYLKDGEKIYIQLPPLYLEFCDLPSDLRKS